MLDNEQKQQTITNNEISNTENTQASANKAEDAVSSLNNNKIKNNSSSFNSKSNHKGQKKDFNPLRKANQPRVDANGFEEKVVQIKRISKTTKGGRHMRFSALVVIGDHKGKVGFGMGKSIEVPDAIKKAIKNARKNISRVIMNKRGTMYHEVLGRHGAGKVLIKPAPEGTGIIAGGSIRAVIELAGYKDVYTKNLGKNTALNMVRATVNGLISQRTPKVIADLRDKKINEL